MCEEVDDKRYGEILRMLKSKPNTPNEEKIRQRVLDWLNEDSSAPDTVEELKKQVDWLAEQCVEFCRRMDCGVCYYHYNPPCPVIPQGTNCGAAWEKAAGLRARA